MRTLDLWKTQREQATRLESGLGYLINEIPGKNRIHLQIWQPRALKPFINYSVKHGEADKYILQANERLIAHKQTILQRKEKRKPTKEKMAVISIGDIFYTVWGWEQTNVDFYQVDSVKGCSLEVGKISSELIEQDTWGSGKVMPIKNAFTGVPFIKKVSFVFDKPSFTISSFETAYIWDGKPINCSWWG